jgi:hypothetical protein
MVGNSAPIWAIDETQIHAVLEPVALLADGVCIRQQLMAGPAAEPCVEVEVQDCSGILYPAVEITCKKLVSA